MGMMTDWRIVPLNALTDEQCEYLAAHLVRFGVVRYTTSKLKELAGEADFVTESNFAVEDIQSIAASFTLKYPDQPLDFYYLCETATCPSGFRAAGGLIRDFSGKVSYQFDDDGSVVD